MGSSPTPIKTCSRPDPPSTPRYRSQNWETSRISRTYRRQVTSSLEADTETHIIGNRPLRRVATSSGANDLVSPKPVPQIVVHKLFQEFPVATIEELANQLERDGEGIDVLTVGGVLHLACGNPLENVLVQTDAIKHVPGDLLAVYQYCKGCKVAVRVL